MEVTMGYLRNAWYVGALSRELNEQPLGRVILDESLVFFRAADGSPVAVADRCPHRFVPLSLGKVKQGELECGYHGLRFGRDGVCVANPHGNKAVPRGANLRHYPIIERYGFIWIWTGDIERADQSLMPTFPFLDSPDQFTAVHGYLPVAGNYQLVVDNLLDLSHVEFLHPMFSQAEGVAGHRTEFFQDGDVVVANRWKPNVPLHGLAGRMFWTSPSTRSDARSHMRWSAPSYLDFDLGATEVGASVEEGICLPNAHLVTPETEFKSHYFWSVARNRLLDDEAMSVRLHDVVDRIFRTEDGPIIEAQQRSMGLTSDLMSLHPVTLDPDIPAVRARRVLARRIEEERQASGRKDLGRASAVA
jgi:phenylpropionate dioxygenase-like ring-hydroxylating dioxygenase large terminal subunit